MVEQLKMDVQPSSNELRGEHDAGGHTRLVFGCPACWTMAKEHEAVATVPKVKLSSILLKLDAVNTMLTEVADELEKFEDAASVPVA